MLDKKSTAANQPTNQPIKRQNQNKRNRFIYASVEQNERIEYIASNCTVLCCARHIYALAPMAVPCQCLHLFWKSTVLHVFGAYGICLTEIACKSHIVCVCWQSSKFQLFLWCILFVCLVLRDCNDNDKKCRHLTN